MTINYTTLLGLAQPVNGTEAGTWGTVVNDEITALVEQAIAGTASIDVTAGNVTLTDTDGASNQARCAMIIATGAPGVSRNVIAPSQSKFYIVINQSNANIVFKGAATTGVTLAAGVTALLAWNGSDFQSIADSVIDGDVFGPSSSVDNELALFSGTSGKTIKRATTTGLLKATSGVIAAATAGTDYAGIDTDQTFTGSQRGAVVTDNDGSLDLTAANNFKVTPTGSFTLTFTNIASAAGQSGFILLVNGSNYTVSAHANTKVSATALSTISATGTYILSYFCDSTNVYVVNSGALS